MGYVKHPMLAKVRRVMQGTHNKRINYNPYGRDPQTFGSMDKVGKRNIAPRDPQGHVGGLQAMHDVQANPVVPFMRFNSVTGKWESRV